MYEETDDNPAEVQVLAYHEVTCGTGSRALWVAAVGYEWSRIELWLINIWSNFVAPLSIVAAGMQAC